MNQSALIMNCTLLPLNKIYRAHLLSPSDSSPSLCLIRSASRSHFASCCMRLNFPPEIESVHTAKATATRSHWRLWQHCEIVEELTGCINIKTQYGGSGAAGVNAIISQKQPGGLLGQWALFIVWCHSFSCAASSEVSSCWVGCFH